MDIGDFVFDNVDNPANGGSDVKQGARPPDDFEAFRVEGFKGDGVIGRGGGQILSLHAVYIDLYAVAAEAAYDRAGRRRPHAADGDADFVFHGFGKREAVFLPKLVAGEHAGGLVEFVKAGFGGFCHDVHEVHLKGQRGHFDIEDGMFCA